MTKLIEVVIASWEQGCCGAPIRLGEPVEYHLVALDPAIDLITSAAGTVRRFTVDNHGQTPADVPQLRVSGVVAGITGVSYPSVPAVGQAGTLTADTTRPELHEVSALGTGADDGMNEYLVLLDVAADTALPAYVLSTERRAQQEREARTAQLVELRARDEVGVLLQALADDARHRFGAVADVLRSDATSAVTISPRRAGTAALHWTRSADATADGIRVQLGDGSWELAATPAQVEVLRIFLEAAAAGRVEELVRENGDGRGELRTRVTAADGRSWVATTPFAPFGDGSVFVSTRQLWQRLQRGDHRYDAWE